MLDAVDELPAPDELRLFEVSRRRYRGHASSRREAPFAALAFKIATDPFVGTLTFFPCIQASLTAVIRS